MTSSWHEDTVGYDANGSPIYTQVMNNEKGTFVSHDLITWTKTETLHIDYQQLVDAWMEQFCESINSVQPISLQIKINYDCLDNYSNYDYAMKIVKPNG